MVLMYQSRPGLRKVFGCLCGAMTRVLSIHYGLMPVVCTIFYELFFHVDSEKLINELLLPTLNWRPFMVFHFISNAPGLLFHIPQQINI